MAAGEYVGLSATGSFERASAVASRTTSLPILLLMVAAFVMVVVLFGAERAFSEEPSQVREQQSVFSCKRDFRNANELLQSDASFDLYNGLAYLGGASALQFGAQASRRWSRTNSFDRDIRGGMRFSGTGDREDADLASDLTLAFSIAVLPAMTMGAKFARTQDCVETWDMFTDVVESAGLAIFVTEVVKVVAGRTRPYTEGCGASPPDDASCGSSDRNESFFSGHSSLAAAGAGLTCSFAIKRDAWGSSASARAAPCALGIASALATGLLRVSADRHWGSDVLIGFGVGALVGYFDTWGPLDLLKFKTRDRAGRISSRGLVLPSLQDGRFGARMVMVF
jgi:membrane-associated phospholipid phosphatase